MSNKEWKSLHSVPAPLSRTEICLKDWKDFKKKFEEYINNTVRISPPNDNYLLSESDKVDELLKVMGKEWQEVYKTFLFDLKRGGPALAQVLHAFEMYCKNPVVEAFKFHSRGQKPGEKFGEFLASIRQQAEFCEFGSFKERMLLDKIVVGVSDKILQQQLLSTKGLTLDTAVLLGGFAEIYQNQH